MFNPMQFIRQRIWAELPTQVTRRQRLQASVLWGGALILWGAVRAWRATHGAHTGSLAFPAALVMIGALLSAALLRPALGERIYLYVIRFFSVIGFAVSTVIFTVAFYLVVTPLGWALRLSGKDLLDIRPGAQPIWRDHTTPNDRKRYYRLS